MATRILVTGGAGYIGSFEALELDESADDCWVMTEGAGLVLEQGLQRSQPERLVENLFNELLPVVEVQQCVFLFAQRRDHVADFRAHIAR